MRWSAAISALLLLTLAGLGPGFAAAQSPGTQAPDFVLKALSGENIRLSEYRGDVVLLSFWATWCGDCRAQLIGFNDMYDRYREAGLALFAVSMDGDRGGAEDAAEALRVRFPVLFDAAGEVGRLYAVRSMPATVLIDREGIVRDVAEGYQRGTQAEYLDRVRALLRE